MLDAVLDFSFSRFVTPRLIRTLYGLTLLAAALSAVTWMFSGFSSSLLYGLFTLITAPLAFLIYVLSARVMMEVVLALFRIAEHIETLSRQAPRTSASPPSAEIHPNVPPPPSSSQD